MAQRARGLATAGSRAAELQRGTSYELVHYDQRTGSDSHEWLLLCILMLLYIVKRLEPLFEFGQVHAPRSTSLMRLDGTVGASPTCC